MVFREQSSDTPILLEALNKSLVWTPQEAREKSLGQGLSPQRACWEGPTGMANVMCQRDGTWAAPGASVAAFPGEVSI